jgi:NADH-quinone oxidoreductase subunit F
VIFAAAAFSYFTVKNGCWLATFLIAHGLAAWFRGLARRSESRRMSLMLADKDRIFTNLYGFQPWNLAAAKKRGDWDDTKALLARADGIIERSRHRACAGAAGRASRPGMKWSFMPKDPEARPPQLPRHQCRRIRAGFSCKDREIIRHDPHKLIEGALVAGFAMRARAAYIYIRGEYIREAEVLFAAVQEAYDAG